MARPRKVGLDYFSHDVDASADDKIKAIEMKYGPVGYSFYFKCLERIYRTDKPIEYPGVFRPIMSGNLRIQENELDEMLDYSCIIKLLSRDKDGSIISIGAQKRRSHIEKERESDRNRNIGNIPPDNSRVPEISGVKERKGKETKINNMEDPGSAGAVVCRRIIDHLNLKARKAFRLGKASQAIIEARLKEGFSEDQLCLAVSNMAEEWGQDEKMQAYLRPETLFRASKFQGYLNRKPQKINGHLRAEEPYVPLL